MWYGFIGCWDVNDRFLVDDVNIVDKRENKQMGHLLSMLNIIIYILDI